MVRFGLKLNYIELLLVSYLHPMSGGISPAGKSGKLEVFLTSLLKIAPQPKPTVLNCFLSYISRIENNNNQVYCLT